MIGRVDEAVAARFMDSFRQLKEWVDDNPKGLYELVADDEPLRQLCTTVAEYAMELKIAEGKNRGLFAITVVPEFIEKWRDYEKRYADALQGIALSEWFGLGMHESNTSAEKDRRHIEDSTREEASAIDAVFDSYNGIDDSSDDEDFVEMVRTARRAWRYLRESAGLDLAAILQRRRLVPFINIPKKVSDAHGTGEALSLLTSLEDAQQAFIFGAPLAALAMMRATMESLLMQPHIRSGKSDYDTPSLEILIERAPLRPSLKKDLVQLRRLANAALHVNNKNFRPLSDLEQTLINGFFALRTLIELPRN